jgi:cell division protein FtsB
LKRILPYLKNKYYIALVFFIVWMLFLDRNDLVNQYEHLEKVRSLRLEKKYYEEEIRKTQQDLKDLSTDQEHLEKFAREKYLMKKDNEDVFVIVREKKK